MKIKVRTSFVNGRLIVTVKDHDVVDYNTKPLAVRTLASWSYPPNEFTRKERNKLKLTLRKMWEQQILMKEMT